MRGVEAGVSRSPDRLRRRIAVERWRLRLREAIDRMSRKHSDITHGAGISNVTLSCILTGETKEPFFSTIVRVAREVGVTVGWLLEERGTASTTMNWPNTPCPASHSRSHRR